MIRITDFEYRYARDVKNILRNLERYTLLEFALAQIAVRLCYMRYTESPFWGNVGSCRE